MNKEVIVVGSGISGATIANILQDNDYNVTIYEFNTNTSGACLDSIGLSYKQVHGSHIFHTNNEDVWNYLSQFTEWLPYQHRVKTMIDGKLYPMPLNRDFKVFPKIIDVQKELTFEELRKHDAELADDIYNKAFKEYSLKQWGTIPNKEVLSRVKAFRNNHEDRYFTDKYQGIPLKGFSTMINKMIDDCTLLLRELFTLEDLDNHKDKKIFFTGSIDALFKYKFGVLPYRTCHFTFTEDIKVHKPQEAAVINYPTSAYKFTRSHDFSWYIPTGYSCMAYEYPREFDIVFDSYDKRYYPVVTENSSKLYQQYVSYAKENYPNLILAGRQGLFKYMNIDVSIETSMKLVNDFITKDKNSL